MPAVVYRHALLIDSGPLIAIADPLDARHSEAGLCFAEIAAQQFHIFVTNVTIAEAHRQIIQKVGVQRGLSFLDGVYDGGVNVVQVQRTDEQAAIEIIRKFSDQDLSFADATALAVMERLGLNKAFSFDHHFSVTGLLRVPPIEVLTL